MERGDEVVLYTFFVLQKLAVGGKVRVDFYFLESHHRHEFLHFIESRFMLISRLLHTRGTSLNYYVESFLSVSKESHIVGEEVDGNRTVGRGGGSGLVLSFQMSASLVCSSFSLLTFHSSLCVLCLILSDATETFLLLFLMSTV